MQAEKLGHVEPQRHQRRILERETTLLLEGHVLHGDVRHVVEVVVAELVEWYMRVRFHDVVVASGPLSVLVATCHIREVEEVVAVVY